MNIPPCQVWFHIGVQSENHPLHTYLFLSLPCRFLFSYILLNSRAITSIGVQSDVYLH